MNLSDALEYVYGEREAEERERREPKRHREVIAVRIRDMKPARPVKRICKAELIRKAA